MYDVCAIHRLERSALLRPTTSFQRSSLGELRNPESLCHFQIWPVLTQATVSCEQWSNWHGNVSVSTYRGRSRSPEKSLCWMTSQLQELSKMRNVYNMTFDFSAFGSKWRKRTTVPAGHVDSADVWALDTMRCRGRQRCSFTGDQHMQLVGHGSSHQCSRTHRSRIYPMKLASRLANLLLGPTLTARMQRTCCDLGMQRRKMTRLAVQSLLCAESNLWHQGCLAFQSQRPCQGVMRHNFLKKYGRRVSFFTFFYF